MSKPIRYRFQDSTKVKLNDEVVELEFEDDDEAEVVEDDGEEEVTEEETESEEVESEEETEPEEAKSKYPFTFDQVEERISNVLTRQNLILKSALGRDEVELAELLSKYRAPVNNSNIYRSAEGYLLGLRNWFTGQISDVDRYEDYMDDIVDVLKLGLGWYDDRSSDSNRVSAIARERDEERAKEEEAKALEEERVRGLTKQVKEFETVLKRQRLILEALESPRASREAKLRDVMKSLGRSSDNPAKSAYEYMTALQKWIDNYDPEDEVKELYDEMKSAFESKASQMKQLKASGMKKSTGRAVKNVSKALGKSANKSAKKLGNKVLGEWK